VFRRWAEGRMYRNTMKIAVQALREAARTRNALEKLQQLDVAEQKLRDASWLRPELGKERFQTGLEEIRRSRERTLRDQSVPAVGRLLEAAEKGIAEREVMLELAGALLAFLYHYCPDHAELQALSAQFRQLGGKQPPYRPTRALSETYHRPEPGAGCGALIGGLLAVVAAIWWAWLTFA